MTTSLKPTSARNTPVRLARLCVASSLIATLVACDGDSQPFEEQAEVLTLDLVSVEVVGPPNINVDDTAEADIIINENQKIDLGLRGTDSGDNAVRLDSADRRWISDNTSVVTVDDNGIVTGQNDGIASVSVRISNIVSNEFTFKVQNSELVEILSIEGAEEIERCLPLPYYAVGLYEDGTTRTLFDASFALDQSSTAILDDTNQSTVRINANTTGALTLIARSGSVEPYSVQVTVLDTLNSISVSPNPLSTDVDDKTNFTATGVYTSVDGTTTKTVDITDNINWVVDESSGGEGSIDTTGDDDPGEFTAEEDGSVVVQAFCGLNVTNIGIPVPVDIDEIEDVNVVDEDDAG